MVDHDSSSQRRIRWRWLLAFVTLVVLLGTASFFIPLPLRDSDKEDAARYIVAFLVDDAPIPGFGERYGDAKWNPGMKHFFVSSDAIPEDVLLSDDPRVIRIESKDVQATFDEHRFKESNYIAFDLTSESENELVFEFSIVSGPLGGNGYQIVFRRTIWGLRASGKMLWVA